MYLVLIVGMFYFMIIRPNKKRMDDQRVLLNSLTVGSRVMLTAGIIGTIRVIGETQIVVELAPGVEVTALKQVVARVLGADDEEFEYSDDGATSELTYSDVLEDNSSASPASYESDAFAPNDGSSFAPNESTEQTHGDSPDFI
jgi:preprotein translocase subunit YajC